MDTSEKYILMCKESPMKEDHEWKIGDLYFDPKAECTGLYLGSEKLPYSHCIHRFAECDIIIDRTSIPYRLIPLYRQDQLQEMLDYRNSIELMHIFYKWFCFLEAVPYSWEPLWLMFVMQKKYSKQWTEKKGEWTDA